MGKGDSGCDHTEKMFSPSNPSVFSPLNVYISLRVMTSGMNQQAVQAQGGQGTKCFLALVFSFLCASVLFKNPSTEFMMTMLDLLSGKNKVDIYPE